MAGNLIAVAPHIVIAATAVTAILVIAFHRSHRLTFWLTLGGIIAASAVLPTAGIPAQKDLLLHMDDFALFYTGLIFASGFLITMLSHDYLENQEGNKEEYYILLLLAILGSSVLAGSTHFASFFLGLEILSISLYALIAYKRMELTIEAGVKYLILASTSAAFLLFGMALIYAESGAMEFFAILSSPLTGTPVFLAGSVMMIIGIGFKLGVVPFHMWTPDVYEGAPAPVAAFIATVSKGAMFAVLLRFFSQVDFHGFASLKVIFTIISVLSMFTGNLLALFQDNIKRILAYSSIAHLGYLLVAFLASGELRTAAVTYYLAAYFVTTLGAFGVITVLSSGGTEIDELSDYRGLFRKSPWLAGTLSLMLFSLAGIPVTAGFIGKFYVMAAGAGSSLWMPVVMLVINSGIGLYYYLRVIVSMFIHPVPEGVTIIHPRQPAGKAALAILFVILLWLGIYPGPAMSMIYRAAAVLY
ncbi:MAG: NADH-quinone oxidoreductase subunit N [Syntrophales bacterium]